MKIFIVVCEVICDIVMLDLLNMLKVLLGILIVIIGVIILKFVFKVKECVNLDIIGEILLIFCRGGFGFGKIILLICVVVFEL